jgi:hypothetical protein
MKMAEKCIFCDGYGSKRIGNKTICDNCQEDLFQALKGNIERWLREEIT